MVFLTTIADGKLDWGSDFNHARFKDFCKHHQGKKLRIELIRPKRSNEQNRFYWKYLELIETETGNLAEDLHTHFKRLLPKRFKNISIKGKQHTIELDKTTTLLSKLEFMDFLDKVCAESGVALPDTKAYHEYWDTPHLTDEY